MTRKPGGKSNTKKERFAFSLDLEENRVDVARACVDYLPFSRQEKKLVDANGKIHLYETAEIAAMKASKMSKKEKRKAAFGWDVFNQDSLYKGYKKRLANLPVSEESVVAVITTHGNPLGDELTYGKNDKVEEANLERMAQELEQCIKSRKKFSRRRQHYEGEDVDYINGQNRIFNRKASQAFDKYTVEIRQNLERGTAL
ncbi:hypothetical protein CCR75_007952 [Bremia lactucae]|uniref:Pre-mRNA-splicing factor SYF2 n=1 Tax=Bremia lactucae TaxID=4779 RepID=A0A976FF36_BRELC|nr:hypothetical protein CCR75_007952 [Bremia lactucae]